MHQIESFAPPLQRRIYTIASEVYNHMDIIANNHDAPNIRVVVQNTSKYEPSIVG
jgi:hypothetical protein